MMANESRGRSRLSLCLAVALLGLLLSGCTPFVRREQPLVGGTYAQLQAGQPLGQTFTARYDGLGGIGVFLRPASAGASGVVRLHLKIGPGEPDLLAAERPAPEVTAGQMLRFKFPAQPLSRGQDYYLELELQGEGALEAGLAPGASYLNGALYQDGAPADAQLSFELLYDRRPLLEGLAAEGIQWGLVLGLAFFLFVVPGWALFAWLWPGWGSLPWPSRLVLSAGVGLALYPLMYLWTSYFGLALGWLYAILPVIAGLLALGYRAFAPSPRKEKAGPRRPWHLPASLWPDLGFVLAAGLVLVTRLWQIRSLDLPLWGDGMQHTLIAQLLADHGGLFSSWRPYTDLTSFTYHFGFHTWATLLHWDAQLAMPQAVLWAGQLANVLAVVGLYPLAVKIGRSRWAGVAAVVVAGLIAPMPSFYVNWGRYTQLAGQAILVTAVWACWELLERRSFTTLEPQEPGETTSSDVDGEDEAPLTSNPRMARWKTMWAGFAPELGMLILCWLALGGLALAHYRVLVFAVVFFAAFGLLQLAGGWPALRRFVLRSLAIGAGGGLLFLPWFLHVYRGQILHLLGLQLSTPASQLSEATQQYNQIGNLFSYLPAWLWLLLPLLAAWGLLRRERGAGLTALWWYLCLLAANPQWLGLPGTGALGSFTVLIAAYIPAGLLAGAAVGWLTAGLEGRAEAVSRRSRLVLLGQALMLALTLLAGVYYAPRRLNDVQPAQFALASRPDLRAGAWIRAHTPQNARFLVNSFFAYGDSLVAGSDGGWWLPLIAGRAVTAPPLNYGNEPEPWPDYRQQVNTLNRLVQEQGPGAPAALAALQQAGVTHIYIGQRQGAVNSPAALLNPQALSADPHFRLVYHQDRVYVFEIIY